MKLIDLVLFLPEFFLLNSIVCLLWLAIYLKVANSGHQNYPNAIWISPVTYTSLFIVLCTGLLLLNTPAQAWTVFNSYVLSGSFELLTKVFLILSIVPIFLITLDSKRSLGVGTPIENVVLKMIILFSLLVIICANDTLILFFALEIYALSSYVLVGQKGSISIFSSEASLKYMILGTIFSLILGYGIAVIYSCSGLTNFSDIAVFNLSNTNNSVYWLFGLVLITTGLLFKISSAPFHFWSPDVYEGSPTTTMFFLSIIPKIALFAILIKIYTLLGLGVNPELSLYFIISGALSVIIGSIGGLYQKRIKRLLAYSMITNTGYLVILLGVSTYFSTSAILFFLFIYIITLIGTFSIVLSNRVEPYKLTVKNLYGLANGFYINSTKAVLFGILLFSSAGLPPFAGFIAKFLAILPLTSSAVMLSSVIIVILFITALSVFYYIRIIKVMSFYRRKFWLFFSPVGGYSATIIALSCVLLVVFFVCAGFLINLSYNAILSGWYSL